jgi:hypothetical protein
MPYSTGPFTAGPPHPRDQDRQKGTDLEPDRGAAAAVYPSISSDDTSLRAGEIDIDDQPVGEFVFPESEKYAERLANFPSIEDPARQPPTPPLSFGRRRRPRPHHGPVDPTGSAYRLSPTGSADVSIVFRRSGPGAATAHAYPLTAAFRRRSMGKLTIHILF